MAKLNKPQPQTEKKPETKAEAVLIPVFSDSVAKKLFLGFALVLLVLMASLSHQYGISGDENFHREYGHDVVNFYSTFGEDRTATSTVGVDSLMIYYGGLFDGTATLLSNALPSVDEWDVRHFWNSIFGFVAMLCAGLVAVEIAGWQAGLLTLIFMAFSPRFFGESMNNPKDITMAAGYMVSYLFILKFLKQLPKPSLKTAIGLGLSIGLAMGIRIGGLLLIPYTFLFYGLAMWSIYGLGGLLDLSSFKGRVWPSFKLVLFATVLGYFSSLIFWPYGLVSPFSHPFEALNVAEKFPVNIKILFEGKHIQSTEVPWYYIPKWLLISTPLFGIIGLAYSLSLISVMRKQKKFLPLGFLFFTLVFPIGYVVYKKSGLYDSMRHFFFVYPSIIILAGLSFSYMIGLLPRKLKYVAVGVILVLIALPARFMFANHPNQYVYFNEIVGGIKGAFGNYETDYYMNSVKQSADWLKKNEPLKRVNGQKLRITSNAVAPCNFYFKKDSADVAVGYTSYRTRNEKDDDYEILYCRFVDRQLLLSGCFPPEQTIHTIYADGVPLSCVVKKSDKSVYEGTQLMNRGDYEGALKLFEPYANKYPKNDVVLSNLGLCYLNAQRLDDAILALNQSLSLNSENSNAGYFLGLAYFYKKDFTKAASILTGLVKENPYFAPPYQVLAQCMMQLGDMASANTYLNMYRQLGGQ
ncbi:MAG: tetratricopeptide repeat protein [Bacteroidota bacterium]